MFESLKEGTLILQPKVDEPRLILCELGVSSSLTPKLITWLSTSPTLLLVESTTTIDLFKLFLGISKYYMS